MSWPEFVLDLCTLDLHGLWSDFIYLVTYLFFHLTSLFHFSAEPSVLRIPEEYVTFKWWHKLLPGSVETILTELHPRDSHNRLVKFMWVGQVRPCHRACARMCVRPPSVSRICCFSREGIKSCAFAMQESQRKEIPEPHSGNQAVKDLPLKMELCVTHFHGLFTLAQLLSHQSRRSYSLTSTTQ